MKTSHILFVCSGNTCRSPMAEVIAAAKAARHGYEFEMRSVGLMAPSGSPASELAIKVAAAHGLDLTAHRARQLTQSDLEWADLVLGMTYGHVDKIRRQVPSLRTLPITGFLAHDHPEAGLGIHDPFGSCEADYESVWSTLEEALDAMLDRLAGSQDNE